MEISMGNKFNRTKNKDPQQDPKALFHSLFWESSQIDKKGGSIRKQHDKNANN
jgi:hypothetical protein